ncbi:hypothetical protein O181_039639 [Austropuccinia psidii MF-1]|uniref:Uncharacterized protein n=1 Tax=Austropuccinia psidii MF-1 TaxID=1389203 RepID=A0A9Q3DAP8_9BASI|nr:hypothetical protein [Austropuccinia psidii MF-1]
MVTINNILHIFFDEMIHLDSGIIIQTHCYPKDRKVVVCLGCLIGDLVANNKVAGFPSHSATRFCSCFKCPKAEIQQLQLGRLRQKQIVKDCSHGFKELRNETERMRMVKKTGVWWSELNHLHFWDPVHVIPIGLMHNWFEGILQHHFQNRWKWDFEKVQPLGNKSQKNNSDDEFEMQDGDTLSQSGPSWEQTHNMTPALSHVRVPFGVTRIPQWLGQAKEGKSKATKWKSLFSIYLPLAEINIFLGDIEKLSEDPTEAVKTCLLVGNLAALVEFTHILKQKSITVANCLHFGEEYCNYCESFKRLFPGCTINPNHHFVLHIKMQLKQWGPLNGVAEFSGERLNGILQ